MRSGARYAALALTATMTAGCASFGARKPSSSRGTTVVTAAGLVGPDGSAQGDAEPELRNRVLQSIPQLKAVPFAFDKAELGPEAVKVLDENAAYLKSHPEAPVMVSGHCDARGTTAYNLALGQRRARIVREYYQRMGVPSRRIATISYGSEHPICAAATEDCHARNRRAETLSTFAADISELPRRHGSR